MPRPRSHPLPQTLPVGSEQRACPNNSRARRFVTAYCSKFRTFFAHLAEQMGATARRPIALQRICPSLERWNDAPRVALLSRLPGNAVARAQDKALWPFITGRSQSSETEHLLGKRNELLVISGWQLEPSISPIARGPGRLCLIDSLL